MTTVNYLLNYRCQHIGVVISLYGHVGCRYFLKIKLIKYQAEATNFISYLLFFLSLVQNIALRRTRTHTLIIS